jgi:hypothetical protein
MFLCKCLNVKIELEKGETLPLSKTQNGLRINYVPASGDESCYESHEFLKSVRFATKISFFFLIVKEKKKKSCVFICAKQQAEHSIAILQQQRRNKLTRFLKKSFFFC